MFQRFGEIKRVSIPVNRETSQPMGCVAGALSLFGTPWRSPCSCTHASTVVRTHAARRAYIEFVSPDAAARALALNGFVHRARQLRVRFVSTQATSPVLADHPTTPCPTHLPTDPTVRKKAA